MGPGPPRTNGEAPAGGESFTGEADGDLRDILWIARGLLCGAEGHDAEDTFQGPGRRGNVVHVHVDSTVVRASQALDPLRGEEVLDVRDEPVPELAADEAALERDLSEADKEDHRAGEPPPRDKGRASVYLSRANPRGRGPRRPRAPRTARLRGRVHLREPWTRRWPPLRSDPAVYRGHDGRRRGPDLPHAHDRHRERLGDQPSEEGPRRLLARKNARRGRDRRRDSRDSLHARIPS